MGAEEIVKSIHTMSQPPLSEDYEGYGWLVGHPINHSMAPLLHNTVFQDLGIKWNFSLLDDTDLSEFLRRIRDPRCFGSAVTMPHKVAILPHLDDLTPEGRDVGAVNTIIIQTDASTSRRKYIGTNTDVIGIRDSFYLNAKDPDALWHGRPGLVVGGGGAARSAVYSLQRMMQCSPIYIVNRDASEVAAVIDECHARGFGGDLIHVQSVEQAEQLEGPGAIVSCVPDFAPKTENEKLARRLLEIMLDKPHKGAILEMCYHPAPWTQIAELSKRAGWGVIPGLEAMIYQGLEQDKLWTGKILEELPVQKVHAAIAAKLGRPHKDDGFLNRL